MPTARLIYFVIARIRRLPDRLYLGVDGGQSSTTALIADEHGRVLGEGVGGPCNHASAAEGRRKFLAAVGGCMEAACAQAGCSPGTVEFSAACFGLSGGVEDKASYIYELVRSRQYKLTHDGEIALTGATGGHAGIIIIAGTGSFAFGRNAEGRTARAGGWGYVYGDEGGAFDITRRALRAALIYEEGWGPATDLLPLLKRAGKAASANELLHRFYGDIPRSSIAAYAPLVTEAAEAGDAVATEIMKEAAHQLCRYVWGVKQQLFPEMRAPWVSYVGGVFRSPALLKYFEVAVKAEVSENVAPPLYRPATGALLEAWALDGLSFASLRSENDGATDSSMGTANSTESATADPTIPSNNSL